MDLYEQLAETEAELETISTMWLAGADLDHVITASAEVCARIYELREQLPESRQTRSSRRAQ